MTGARLHHAALTVSDLEAAMAFFATLFGYTPDTVERDLTDVGTMTGQPGLRCDFAQMRGADGGVLLELIRFHGPGAPVPPADHAPWRPGAGHVAFHVADFDGTLARAQTAGARLLGAPVAWPGGRAAYLQVPGGAFIEIEWLIPPAGRPHDP